MSLLIRRAIVDGEGYLSIEDLVNLLTEQGLLVNDARTKLTTTEELVACDSIRTGLLMAIEMISHYTYTPPLTPEVGPNA